MRSAAIVLASAVLLVGTAGCAPSIDGAIEKCAQSFAQILAETQTGGLSDDEKKLALEDGREMCTFQANDDPDGFLEQWG